MSAFTSGDCIDALAQAIGTEPTLQQEQYFRNYLLGALLGAASDPAVKRALDAAIACSQADIKRSTS